VHWIQTGHEVSPDDTDFYVSLEDGLDDLIEFIREHPCPRLGYHTAGDLPPDWGQFWKDAVMLKRIEAEGPATYLYARTGLLSGVPDWIVWNLLTEEPDNWTGLPWWTPGYRVKQWSPERIGLLLGKTYGTREGIDAHVLRYR
jgi:hypothetical protein